MSVAAPYSRRPSSKADGRIDDTMTIERRARVIPTVSSRSPSGVDRSPKSLSTRPCLVSPKPSEKITRSRLSATDSSRVSTAKRLGGVARDEVGDIRSAGEGRLDGGADALGVPRARGDDHERLGRRG